MPPSRPKRGPATGPNPTDRGKPGTKRHLVTDARGTPPGLRLTGANRHDSPEMAPTLDAIPPVRSQSKLACLIFALELQRRSDANGWGLAGFAAHPGIS